MICTLCPRRCAAPRDEQGGSGFCGLPETMRIARVAPHLWEEPPISGQRGTGAVFFSGCTLRCVYCQNREISHTGAGRAFTPAELSQAMRSLVDAGMQSISLITATPYVEPILEAMARYRPPVPVVWNSSGYERVETLRRLEEVVDVYLPDLKHFTPAMGQLCAGAPDYFEAASAAITEMVRQKGTPVYDENGIMQRGVLIRHLILPGCVSESIALLDWVAETLPEGIPLSLMRQYVPCGDIPVPGLRRRITNREYRLVRDHMRALGLPGFTQAGESADTAFIPAFNQADSFIMDEQDIS